jgi:hypothetical protein
MIRFLVAALLALPAAAARVEVVEPLEAALPSAPAPTLAAPITLVAAPLSASAAPAPALLVAPSAAPSALPSAAALAVSPNAAAVPALAASPDAAPSAPDRPLFGGSAAPARPVFGRRAAAPAQAPAADAASAEDTRGHLAALAAELDRSARPDAAPDAADGALSRVWDFVRDRRPAAEENHLQARLDAAKSFLRSSLDEPLVSGRVAATLRAQKVLTPGMDLPPAVIVSRLRRALAGRIPIRLASPSERSMLGKDTLAVAWTHDGKVEVLIHPDSEILGRAPPPLLAATLLHELVHAEFDLGEHAAYLTETAYYARLRGLIPGLADDPDAKQLESLLQCLRQGDLSEAIVAAYGKKLKQSPDDIDALARLDRRRSGRVAAALDAIGALAADGSWDRIEDKSAWVAKRLPLDADRKLYFELVQSQAARLPAGTPFAEVFRRAAVVARSGK